MKTAAIIVAAGSGTRMGAGKNKVFLKFNRKPVLRHTLAKFENCDAIDHIVVVTRDCDMDKCKKIIARSKKPVHLVSGGDTRQQSVLNGLLSTSADIVAIHDGARALVSTDTITKTIENAKKYGASAAGVKSKDSLKSVTSDGFIKETIDRESTYLIQTPQVFGYTDILNAHQSAQKDGFSATDDCAVYEKYIGRVKITEGSYKNIKLTTPEDLIYFKNALNNNVIKRIKRR